MSKLSNENKNNKNNGNKIDFARVSPNNPDDLYTLAKVCLKNLTSEITLLKTCDPAVSEEDILHDAIVGILEAFKKESVLKKKFLQLRQKYDKSLRINPEKIDSIFRYNLFVSWVRARIFSSFNHNNISRIILHHDTLECEEIPEKEFIKKKHIYKKFEKENKITIISFKKTLSLEDLSPSLENNNEEKKRLLAEEKVIPRLEKSSPALESLHDPHDPESLLIEKEEELINQNKQLILSLINSLEKKNGTPDKNKTRRKKRKRLKNV